VLVVVFVIFALFAPWIAPQDPASIDLPARLDTPTHAHWFGTDELGRDILSRVILRGTHLDAGGKLCSAYFARAR